MEKEAIRSLRKALAVKVLSEKSDKEGSVPHRAPGAPGQSASQFLRGKPIKYYRPTGSQDIRALIDGGFQAFNAGRLSEACHIYTEKMLAPENDTTIGLTVAGALTPAGLGGCIIELMDRGLVDFVISTGANLYHDLHYALNFTLHRGSPFLDDVELYEQGIIRIYDVLFPATVLLETDSYIRDFLVRAQLSGAMSTADFHYRLGQDLLERNPGCEEYSVVARAALAGVPIYTSSPGDSSIGMNIAYHELMNGGTLMIDPNRDVNEVCAIILAGKQNGCVILGGGSPKNFYLQGQPTLWEVYGIPKGGNDYFIQLTTDQVVWGGLSGATPAEAVSWGKVNPGVLPDTVVAYVDSTIGFPLFCEYAVAATHNRRERKELVHKRGALVADLLKQAKAAEKKHPEPADNTDVMPDLERHR
jgi:deoxyhypusine synthase